MRCLQRALDKKEQQTLCLEHCVSTSMLQTQCRQHSVQHSDSTQILATNKAKSVCLVCFEIYTPSAHGVDLSI